MRIATLRNQYSVVRRPRFTETGVVPSSAGSIMSPTKLRGHGLQTPKALGINWTEDKVQEALDVKRKIQGPILPIFTSPTPPLVQRDRRVRAPSNTSPFHGEVA